MSEVRLRDYIETIKGFAFKSEMYQDYGTPIIRVSDFTQNSISDESLIFIDKSLSINYEKYNLNEKDILIQTVGSWQNNPASVVGKVVNVPYNLNSSLLNQNAVKIIPKSINKTFLFYLLKSDYFKYYILSTAQGAANQASITLESIGKFRFKLPSKNEQEKIANILSNYDNLIENNNKRIKLLEEMAEEIYKEWFVRLRFPEFKNTKIVDGIPSGWEERIIQEFCLISGGGTPSTTQTSYWENGTINWYTPSDLSNINSICSLSSQNKITLQGLSNSSAKLLNKNSFMMTSRATIGLFAISNKDFCTNQGFINITPTKSYEKYYLLYNLKYRVDEFKMLGTGATFPEISKSVFNKLKIIIPNSSIIKKFDELISPIINELFILTEKNQNLKQTRDLLLPRLISGKLNIEDLDIK